MSDDLRKRLWLQDMRPESVSRQAADRIEELEAEVDKWKQAFSAQSAKLLKAVVTLRFYAPSTVDYPGGPVNFVGGDDAGKRAAATLAEIKP